MICILNIVFQPECIIFDSARDIQHHAEYGYLCSLSTVPADCTGQEADEGAEPAHHHLHVHCQQAQSGDHPIHYQVGASVICCL